MKILVVDDFVTNVSILRVTLTKIGHTVFTARDGIEAIAILKAESIDAVLTDWMMPNLDGLGLIRWIRSSLQSPPLVIVITALRISEAETQALNAGADAFLVKPVSPTQVGSLISDLRTKREIRIAKTTVQQAGARQQAPSYCGVAFGAGSGGAAGIRKIFSAMPAIPQAAFFIVLHGPGWAAEALGEQMESQFQASVVIPKENEKIKPGTIYIAPGDKHMIVAPDGATIQLPTTQPENFHRPSIDPLFRSVAEVFGRRGIGIVLAGTGIDGYIGAGYLQVAHGTIIVQEPNDGASSQMTQNVITLGLATRVLPLEKIGGEISDHLRKFNDSRLTGSTAHNPGYEK